MVNFKQYLLEATGARTQEIPLKSVKDLVTTKCSEFLTTNTAFFRGSKNIYKAALIEPKKWYRKSSTTSKSIIQTFNMHNYLMSILPSWNQYPKRTASVIFTPDEDTAEHYTEEEEGHGGRAGCVLEVYPYNGAKIGCCKTSDVWGHGAFSYMAQRVSPKSPAMIDITYFCGSLNKLLNYYFYEQGIKYDSSEKILINALNAFDKLIQTEHVLDNIPSQVFGGYIEALDIEVFNDLKEHYKGNIWNYLDGLLNPTANEFRLLHIGDLATMGNTFSTWHNELWTDSPCILINTDYSDKI